MSVPGKRGLFLVGDWHSRHEYNRQPCFELIYVAQGVHNINVILLVNDHVCWMCMLTDMSMV